MKEHKKDDDDAHGCFVSFTIVSGILLALSFLIVAFQAPTSISKIVNPEYHAMAEIVKMVNPHEGGRCK